MSSPDYDTAEAVIFGLALGDALGWPVELLELAHIRAKYGRAGITAPPDPALYSDDTQMSVAVAEALVEAGHTDLDTLMDALAHHFIAWKNDPITPSRAPGTTCIRGVNALEFGAPWREAGVKGSKGCGSCMRVAPIGYFYQHQHTRLMSAARAQGWMTHRHPTADAACIAAAYLVKLALDGEAPTAYPEAVLARTNGISEEFDAAIQRAAEAVPWPDQEMALKYVGPTRGGGWIAEEAVAMALYCVLKQPDDYAAAITLAANISGDSDNVACITGGILGARLGRQGLPEEWVARLENRAQLEDLAHRLAEKKSELESGA